MNAPRRLCARIGAVCALLAASRAFALPVPDAFMHFRNASSHLVKLCSKDLSHCSHFRAGTQFDLSEATNGQGALWLAELYATMAVQACGRTLALDHAVMQRTVVLKGTLALEFEFNEGTLRQACAGRKG